jgi:hypothetical protein
MASAILSFVDSKRMDPQIVVSVIFLEFIVIKLLINV